MGLDTSHDCWHGAYSAFTHWRHRIAELAGYAVWPVVMSDMTRDMIMIDWGHITEKNLAGKWKSTPADPLLVIFAHSDCDGKIYPEQANALADALEALLPAAKKYDKSTPAVGHVARNGGIYGSTLSWVKGLRKAAAAGEPVDFH